MALARLGDHLLYGLGEPQAASEVLAAAVQTLQAWAEKEGRASADLGASWLTLADLGGLIDGVALSPGFTSDDTLVAATVNQGLWASTNAGLDFVDAGTGLFGLFPAPVEQQPFRVPQFLANRAIPRRLTGLAGQL